MAAGSRHQSHQHLETACGQAGRGRVGPLCTVPGLAMQLKPALDSSRHCFSVTPTPAAATPAPKAPPCPSTCCSCCTTPASTLEHAAARVWLAGMAKVSDRATRVLVTRAEREVPGLQPGKGVVALASSVAHREASMLEVVLVEGSRTTVSKARKPEAVCWR
ncbi:hypothetical protein HaLaN_00327 [Haematococcus lacustris]|uniref:Uncharacterized protein n=1 Tax=Haematococcus lacustris TaxID=44745 RepID=A0A699Y6X8_HAELA|nr:hypothetical protein HaLaN_00327 [Haematococcus lacustris]